MAGRGVARDYFNIGTSVPLEENCYLAATVLDLGPPIPYAMSALEGPQSRVGLLHSRRRVKRIRRRDK